MAVRPTLSFNSSTQLARISCPAPRAFFCAPTSVSADTQACPQPHVRRGLIPSSVLARRLKQLVNDLAANVGQAFFATIVQDSQHVLVQPQLLENGRVQIANVAGTLNRSQADFVGRTDSASPLNS